MKRFEINKKRIHKNIKELWCEYIDLVGFFIPQKYRHNINPKKILYLVLLLLIEISVVLSFSYLFYLIFR